MTNMDWVYSNALKMNKLAEQVPIHISSVLIFFLKYNKTSSVSKRKREIHSVVPATFMVYTENTLAAEILDNELLKRKRMFTVFELKQKPKGFFRKFPTVWLLILAKGFYKLVGCISVPLCFVLLNERHGNYLGPFSIIF